MSFDFRPLIEPHVRISRIRLSDGVAPLQGVRATFSSHNHLNRLFHCSIHFGNQRSVVLMNLLPPIPYLNWATVYPLFGFAKAGPLRIIGVLSSRLLPGIHWHRHHCYYANFLKKFNQKRFAVHPTSRIASFRLSRPGGYTFLTSEPLPYSRTRLRTIRDLPRSPNQPFVFIPTLSRHANPLW